MPPAGLLGAEDDESGAGPAGCSPAGWCAPRGCKHCGRGERSAPVGFVALCNGGDGTAVCGRPALLYPLLPYLHVLERLQGW